MSHPLPLMPQQSLSIFLPAESSLRFQAALFSCAPNSPGCKIRGQIMGVKALLRHPGSVKGSEHLRGILELVGICHGVEVTVCWQVPFWFGSQNEDGLEKPKPESTRMLCLTSAEAFCALSWGCSKMSYEWPKGSKGGIDLFWRDEWGNRSTGD